MRPLVLALLALAICAGAAQAAGLDASAGGRYGRTTVLVAGRPAVVVSTLYLEDSLDGCEHVHRLEATFTPPPGIDVRGPRTVSPRLRRHRKVNATWHVRAVRAGVAWGRVAWRGTGAGGKSCTGSQHLRVVTASAPPTLSVVAAVRFHERVGVVLRAGLPGVTPRVGEAFDAFFTEQHVLGRAGRSVFDALRPRAAVEDDFEADGLNCVLIDRPRESVAYRLRFTWNHAIGAASIVRSGSLPVAAAPRNETERACERQYHPVCDRRSPCEGPDPAVASRRGP